ncbi:MAG: cation transporter [Chitinophagales bacterium]|nr:cation transporter [Chitinophagales bacterium]HNI44095.1 cation transporter [Chitinophagales bacterium]
MLVSEQRLFSRAAVFAAFVCFYNIAEGIVAMLMGYKDESLTLFGFGVDSFIEVSSNLGVLYMIFRIRENPLSDRSPFERTALNITGYSFYALAVTLVIGIALSIITEHRPTNTFWGVIISCVSIVVMYFVASSQLKTGAALNSQPIIADARCTMICIYMSIVLLVSSLVYKLTGFAYSDAIGAAGLVYFSIQEGKEALDKATGKKTCCDTCHNH